MPLMENEKERYEQEQQALLELKRHEEELELERKEYEDLIKHNERKRFMDQLESASKTVESWPEWKRNILGKY